MRHALRPASRGGGVHARACAAAQRGDLDKLRATLLRRPGAALEDGAGGASGYTPFTTPLARVGSRASSSSLRSGADVNRATTAGGATPLHRAAFTGRVEVVRALLAAGARPAQQDADLETPLHKASAGARWSRVEVLLRAHPDAIHLVDRRGATPADRAKDDATREAFERVAQPRATVPSTSPLTP